MRTPATASISDVSFDNGDVPKAKGAIEKLKKKLEKCVNDAGGIAASTATLKLQFLVRSPGVAEGVDVLDAQGIEEKPGKCIRDIFKRKPMGSPSTDPVGVTVTIQFDAVSRSD